MTQLREMEEEWQKVLMYPCAFRLHQFKNEARDSNPRGFSPFASIILNC